MSKLLYLSLIRSLMYALMGTCQDIMHAISHLGKYSANPMKAHWTATQWVFHYLNGTHDLGLVLDGQQPITLQGDIDSDFAQDLDDQSILGYTFNLSSGAISWSLKKQATVASSSTEAKYVATDHVTKEAMWLHMLLSLIG